MTALPLRPLLLAAYALLAMLVAAVFVGVATALRADAGTDLVTLTTAQVLGYSAVLLLVVRVHAPDESLRDFLGVRRPKPSVAVFGALAGALAYPLASRFDEWMATRFPATQAETEALEQIVQTATVRNRVEIVICLALVIPAASELFYRGALFALAKRWGGTRAAILAPILLPVLMQSSLRSVGALLVVALLSTALRWSTENVVVAGLAHVGFFASGAVPLVVVGREWSAPWSVAGALFAVSVLLVALTFLRRSEPGLAASEGLSRRDDDDDGENRTGG